MDSAVLLAGGFLMAHVFKEKISTAAAAAGSLFSFVRRKGTTADGSKELALAERGRRSFEKHWQEGKGELALETKLMKQGDELTVDGFVALNTRKHSLMAIKTLEKAIRNGVSAADLYAKNRKWDDENALAKKVVKSCNFALSLCDEKKFGKGMYRKILVMKRDAEILELEGEQHTKVRTAGQGNAAP
jgi:hypothetical protein